MDGSFLCVVCPSPTKGHWGYVDTDLQIAWSTFGGESAHAVSSPVLKARVGQPSFRHSHYDMFLVNNHYALKCSSALIGKHDDIAPNYCDPPNCSECRVQ